MPLLFKMDAPRALVFRPLVKGNEALGTRLALCTIRSHGTKSHMLSGVQIAQFDFQNNKTRNSPPGPAFVLDVPLRNLRISICDFVPCDRIVHRTY